MTRFKVGDRVIWPLAGHRRWVVSLVRYDGVVEITRGKHRALARAEWLRLDRSQQLAAACRRRRREAI